MACSVALGVVLGTITAAFHLQKTPSFQLLQLSLYGFLAGAVLVTASVIRGRIIGGGNIRQGLGLVPVTRLPIVILLAISIAAYAALRHYAVFKLRPDLFYEFASASMWSVMLQVSSAVVVAPISEELFFRGWLWNGLRLRWAALPVALLTTAFWLVLHVRYSASVTAITLMVALLPVGLLLALVRQVSNSVYASIALHAIYNFVVVLPMLLMGLGLLHQVGPVQQNGLVQQNSPIQQGAPAKQNRPADQNVSTPQNGSGQRNVPSWFQQYGQTTQTPGATSPAANTNAPTIVNREVFTGSESQIAAMNFVNMDCSSDAVPEVRVVTAPANGQTRLQQLKIPIVRPANAPLAHCNGKPVEAMGVFYKSKSDFRGSDTMTLDVDFHHGKVTRFIYNISVR
jgi:membrane protease YdiL (CAAX protease family)